MKIEKDSFYSNKKYTITYEEVDIWIINNS
jgi:hypothetical protein